MRRHLLDLIVLFVLSSLICGYVSLAQPAARDVAVHVYVFLVGGLLMLGLVAAAGDSVPRRTRSELDRALAESEPRDRRIPEVERDHRQGTGNALVAVGERGGRLDAGLLGLRIGGHSLQRREGRAVGGLGATLGGDDVALVPAALCKRDANARDVVASLLELDPHMRLLPAVDVLLARVVGGEGEPLVVVVPIEQVPEVPRAVTDVDVRVRQV